MMNFTEIASKPESNEKLKERNEWEQVEGVSCLRIHAKNTASWLKHSSLVLD